MANFPAGEENFKDKKVSTAMSHPTASSYGLLCFLLKNNVGFSSWQFPLQPFQDKRISSVNYPTEKVEPVSDEQTVLCLGMTNAMNPSLFYS